MDNDPLPVGVSEDEAYRTPLWVMPVVGASVVALGGMTLFLAVLGFALVAGDETTVKAWDFWGATRYLGALWLAAALLMALGLATLARRSDDSLALLLLGVVVFSGSMLWALVRFRGSGGPALILLLMLVPLLALGGLQLDGTRRWLFHPSGEDG